MVADPNKEEFMVRKILIPILVVVWASSLMAKSNLPKANTRAEVKAYVDRAAKVVASKGSSCDTFKDKSWASGDWYIFVTQDGKIVCHPNASMIGKAESDVVDANGKKVGAEITAAAKKKGGGWVDYVWPRPGTDKPVPKSSYARTVKGSDGKTYAVGSGGYDLK
jgi:signal transduction histidine kinase